MRLANKEKLALDRAADEKIIERTYPLYLLRRQLKTQLARSRAKPPATDPPAAAPAAAAPPPAAPAPVPAAPAAPAPIRPRPGAEEEDPFGARIKPSADHNVHAQFGGMGSGGSQVMEPIPSAEEVAGLIRELLPDPSWKEEGVLLKPFRDVLIVRQRGPMLRKNETLLGDIDAWQPLLRTGMGGGFVPVVGDYR